MREHYRQYFVRYWRETIGFALFLAWVYCTLFGCGLATHDEATVNLPTTYNLEHIWMVSGLFEVIGTAVGLVIAQRIKMHDQFIRKRFFGIVALICAIFGNILIWLAWMNRLDLFPHFYWYGGALAGVAVALYTLIWGVRLKFYDEAYLEFAIPFSFTISFIIYFLLLLTKQDSTPILIALMVLIGLSALFASRAQPAAGMLTADQHRHRKSASSGRGSFCILVLFSWVQVAFFRIISTPELMGDRFTHYLIPFSSACVISFVMLMACIRLSRYLNVSLAYRWSLPLFILSYVPILIDYDNPWLRIVAYAINFLGMFGVQFGFWMGTCKYVRRTRCDALGILGAYAICEGAGIFLGCFIGLFGVKYLDFHELGVLAIILMATVTLGIMVTGFNPSWVFHRTRTLDCAEGDSSHKGKDEFDLDLLFEQEASTLQNAYGLTNRETDVAALLLAGRSRPFIRDELVVSINTVSSHVRSIFSKCGVHSQQELMNLARGGGSVRTVTPCEKPRQPR